MIKLSWRKTIRRFQVLLFIVLLILLLFTILNFIPPTVSADDLEPEPREPRAVLKLNDQSQTAEVGPGDTGEVEFNGSVTVLFPSEFYHPEMVVIVTLFAEDTWHSAEVEPSSITFTRNDVKYFMVHVRAPNGEFLTNTGTVTITGRWRMEPPGESGPAEPKSGVWGRINIEQFSKFSISSSKTSEVCKPGENVKFELDIKNEGNFLDTFSIEHINEDELYEKDTIVMLTQSKIEIIHNSTKTIGIEVILGDCVKSLGKHEIKLRVILERGENSGLEPQVITFEIDVPRGNIIYTSEFSNAIIIIVIIIFIILFLFWRRRKKSKENRRRKINKKPKNS